MIYKKNSIQVQITASEFREYLAKHPELVRKVYRQDAPVLIAWYKSDAEYASVYQQGNEFIMDSDEWLKTDEAKQAAEWNAASVAGQIEAGGVEPFN